MRIEPPVSEPSAAQAAPLGDRRRAARGRAAGDARRRVERRRRRVGRRAVVRVDADAGEGELRHVGAADERGAGPAQAGDGGRVGGGGRGVGEHGRAGGGGFAGDVEQVLDRDREAGERARVGAGGDRAVGRRRRRARAASKLVEMKARADCGARRRRSTARSGRPRRRSRQDCRRASVRSSAHRGCYNHALCLGRTSEPDFRVFTVKTESSGAVAAPFANRLIQGVAASIGGACDSSRILDPTFGVLHVDHDARNAGSRRPFRTPDPLLEPQDGPVHLRPSQQDPHHQSREDAAALRGRDEVHPPAGRQARHDPDGRHQAPGARSDRRWKPSAAACPTSTSAGSAAC